MGSEELLGLEQARGAVLDQAVVLPAERVALRAALGRVLAEDVVAAEAGPAFDSAARDGVALRAEDTGGAGRGAPAVLRVAGESRAGLPTRSALRRGEAIRISTGAAIPAGADAVTRLEDTRSRGDRVLLADAIEAGRDIRRVGDDIAAGATVLERGTAIGPAELGVLASIGRPRVACHRRPRVRVLTSGDELLDPGEPMRPGGVRDSNAYSIPALVEWAGAETVGIGSMPDDPGATRAAIAAALDADVVVLCGGVSVGEHDHVKGALSRLGVDRSFWGIALKPGKPTWFGTRDGTLVFGLPGNPVSAMVTFALLTRPALARLSGRRPERGRTLVKLARDCEKTPGRVHAIRCRLEPADDGWRAWPAPRQGSHILTSMLGTGCLAMLPAGRGLVRAGELVEAELLGRGSTWDL